MPRYPQNQDHRTEPVLIQVPVPMAPLGFLCEFSCFCIFLVPLLTDVGHHAAQPDVQ